MSRGRRDDSLSAPGDRRGGPILGTILFVLLLSGVSLLSYAWLLYVGSVRRHGDVVRREWLEV
jgi:hypothetical protein